MSFRMRNSSDWVCVAYIKPITGQKSRSNVELAETIAIMHGA
jgi:hypothetical protein